MNKLNKIPQYDANHYAVVDLGSNSFHLLITHLHNNQLKTVNKVKRKVRLAAGLNEHLELSSDAMKRGFDCLNLFAQHLASIPLNNIRIVATATLRIAKNSNSFIAKANQILPLKINLLNGYQEASTIYSGVAHTCKNDGNEKKLVIDIGGASTELIIGQGFTADKAISLNIGCVSFIENYFTNGQLTEKNFATAIDAACRFINPISVGFLQLGWQSAVGSSGTIQALIEILSYRQQQKIITATFLQEIKQSLIQCGTIDNIVFDGLRSDRSPVLASGLSILIALFNCLEIKELKRSTGALREGLLFEMLPNSNLI